MRTLTRAAVVAGLALCVSRSTPHAASRTAAPPPSLAVIIVVDQMRADYVERFKGDWSAGLKRLVTEGAWFRHAAYPYLSTATCAGHATVSSGAFPHKSGVIQNGWWDRGLGRMISCTDDSAAADIGYRVPPRGGNSAAALGVPSFADIMRAERSARVVSLSIKSDAAIMLAGHGGDAVAWLSEEFDRWITSSMYARGPIAAVDAFAARHSVDADYDQTWTRLLPLAHYAGADAGDGEAPPKGWTPRFPHVLSGTNGRPDADFHQQWLRSPYPDAYVGRMAAALTEAFGLGTRQREGGADVLAISFSSTDLVGHAFGPRSHEVQDVCVRLDRTIGTLLDRLDALVGRDRYVVALTADHGVTAIPEQLIAEGNDGGRLNAGAIARAVDSRLSAALGPRRYVARVNLNDVYFEPGIYEQLRSAPAALEAVIATIHAVPGVARVFRGEAMRDASTSPDPLLRAAALSYFPGRSGDLVLVPKAGWMFGSSGTTHGTAHDDDQRVPIMIMGRGIRPGQYLDAVTPADVAPTLAALFGIVMPQAEGRALRQALLNPPDRGRRLQRSDVREFLLHAGRDHEGCPVRDGRLLR